jgi:8-oxo-dGTP pyrophosphatase MutT (NUDIX family)
MSYEADAHEAQMDILKHLLHVPDAGFAELQKTAGLTSDHFNFHIRRLQDAKYVTKNGSGRYHLTQAGKEYANRMDTDEKVIERQAKLGVLIVVENEKGQFVAQQRLKQPYYGFWGRPTGKIRWGETVVEAAARELMEETGLSADLELRGIFHKMDYRKDSDEFLEDKYFYIVYGTNPRGTLTTSFEGGKNSWMSLVELKNQEQVFQDVVMATEIAKKPGVDFVEKKYHYTDDEY